MVTLTFGLGLLWGHRLQAGEAGRDPPLHPVPHKATGTLAPHAPAGLPAGAAVGSVAGCGELCSERGWGAAAGAGRRG